MARSVADAIKALEIELGVDKLPARPLALGRAARLAEAASERPRNLPEGWIDWKLLYEWCRANPGLRLEIDDVHRQGIVRFRARHPDLTVESYGYHYRHEGGPRVATLAVRYDPPKREEASRA